MLALRPAGIALAGLLAAAALGVGAATAADGIPQRRTITMTGEGEMRAAPDMAVISSGVVSEADTARAALDANNAAMARVIDTVAAAGIERRDIQTSGFSVNPRYVHPAPRSDGTQEPPRISGYTVANTVTATVRDLKALGPVLDAVVSAGSNQIHGLSFTIADPKPLQDEARRKAVRDAVAKASLYAAEAGVVLGDIIAIAEHAAPPPQPVYARRMAMDAAAGAVPIAEGEQSVAMQVTVTWEIR